jgi:TPR repeat protein
LLSLLVCACHEWTPVRECPAGQQEHEDRCLPTPTLVFLQCVEAFRTEKVEHDRSSRLALEAKGPPTGGAAIGGSLERAKLDRESREYTEMTERGIGIAVAECRRQEQAERESRLALALQDAETARSEMRTARAEAATATAQLEGIEKVASELRGELEATQQELAASRERMSELDPCGAKLWDACIERGIAADETGDHPGAAQMFDAACKGGHGDACDRRARMLEHGVGLPRDLAAAYRHYARACELGGIDACVSEAMLRQQGRGTKRDPDGAARRFATACREDSGRACWCFADALERGLGIDRDDDRAAKFYGRACELGEAQACEDGERLAGRIARAEMAEDPSD